jgi:hypothetical protein
MTTMWFAGAPRIHGFCVQHDTLTTHMKISYILGCSLLLFVLGCKHGTQSDQTPPPPPEQSKTITEGGVTWTLGAATINGTNVALSNITVRADTNRVSK